MKLVLLQILIIVSSLSYGQVYLDDSNGDFDIIDTSNPNIKKVKDNIFYYLNQVRKSNNKAEFTYNLELEAAAQYHSIQMNIMNFFGHRNKFDSDLETPLKRILRFGGNYPYIAENISITSILNKKNITGIKMKEQDGITKYYSLDGVEIKNHTYKSLGKKVVANLLNSNKHKKDILNPDLKDIGIGIVIYSKNNGSYTQYYVLITQDIGGY